MKPILILRRRRFSFQWTSLAYPVNDALRCIALCTAANSNDLRGRPTGPEAA